MLHRPGSSADRSPVPAPTGARFQRRPEPGSDRSPVPTPTGGGQDQRQRDRL